MAAENSMFNYALHISYLNVNDPLCRRCAEGLANTVNQIPRPIGEKNWTAMILCYVNFRQDEIKTTTTNTRSMTTKASTSLRFRSSRRTSSLRACAFCSLVTLAVI